MKNSMLFFALFITTFLSFQNLQAQIKGNGNVIIQEIEVVPFEKIHINFPVLLEVDAAAETALTIITDDNILPAIVLKNEENQLSILQDEWIQPTKTVVVKIGTKHLKYLELSGYTKANISNLDEDEFQLYNEVGKVTLSGKVNTLNFSLGKGTLQAETLVVQNVSASISGSGKAVVNAVESIEGEIGKNGKLVYVNPPKVFNLKSENGEVFSVAEEKAAQKRTASVQYINLTLRNNKFKRVHTVIEGPKEKKFGYGLPFNPKQKRKERYPVGTKIYVSNLLGNRTVLVTVRAADEGKVVDLFQ